MGSVRELNISHIGHKGDGVSETECGPVYVPFALAGERVRAEVEGERGRLLEVLKFSADRVDPFCQYFGTCGGCALQHLSLSPYLDWKREQVGGALTARGIVCDVSATFSVGLHERRRVVISAERVKSGLKLGFHKHASHDLVDIHACPITVEGIAAALPQLRALAGFLLAEIQSLRMTVLACDNGLDVAVEYDGSGVVQADGNLVTAARRVRIVRLSVNDELVYSDGCPYLLMGLARVTPPPGGFVQASKLAEEHIVDLILQSLDRKCKRVADLFCGLGSFALPLAQKTKILAVDSDAALVAALNHAAKNTQGLKQIETKVRDLMREPLSRRELNNFDAVLFDPPRAGARAQAQTLANSDVQTVFGVSCNPGTFARDARILVDGGYQLDQVVPIDQFVYSSHIEIFSVFRR